MSFTRRLWEATRPIFDAILAHPFNRELAAGALRRDRFAYYVQQDSLYLGDYARSLALLAARAPTSGIAGDLLTYANEGIEVERLLHGHFFSAFSILPADRREPACFAYTQFLLARTALDSFEVGLAAVLPCFWIYREAGIRIAAGAADPNPYAPWIRTYSDAAFGRAVERMLAITDAAGDAAAANVRAAMLDAYTVSARCEWAFWDAAYRLERWAI